MPEEYTLSLGWSYVLLSTLSYTSRSLRTWLVLGLKACTSRFEIVANCGQVEIAVQAEGQPQSYL